MKRIEDTNFYTRVGHLHFWILIISSVVFYKERVCLLENTMFFWNIIGVKTFDIYFNRYSAVLTQILPLMSIKLTEPLCITLIAYSVSFPLIAYLGYIFCLRVAKHTYAALAIVLLSCIGVRVRRS